MLAAVFAAGLVIWMASGLLKGEAGLEQPGPDAQQERDERFAVRAVELRAELVTPEVIAHGRTAPSRTVTVRSEITGQVVEIGAGRGSLVEAGALIVAVDSRDREERLKQAQANVNQRRLESEAAQRLARQGLQSEAEAAAAQAGLQAALASLTQARIEMERTRIVAPFEGRLQDRAVEVGDYVSESAAIAVIHDLDPIITEGFVTEKQVGLIHEGGPAYAVLSTGERIEGRLRYVAPAADPQSRMFRVEMESENNGSRVRAGLTADLRMPLEPVSGHLISPAALVLSEAGEVGVMFADEGDIARFVQVEIIKTTQNGIWVEGLPEVTRLITVGKDFVQNGDEVRVVMETARQAE